MIYEVRGSEKINRIFAGWNETMIWSCLQGVMGRLYADSEDAPSSAMAILGSFCFLAGRPNMELVSFKPDWCCQDYIIMVPSSREWIPLIGSAYAGRAFPTTRYAFRKDPDAFDREKLAAISEKVEKPFYLRFIDRELFAVCRDQGWCRDFVALYDGYDMYERMGLGVAAMYGGEIVAGASSYSSYRGGIEIEIDTRKDYRRRGLAAACGAKLILECLGRGLYPSWDAANLRSVALAEKLGYVLDREYAAYEICGY